MGGQSDNNNDINCQSGKFLLRKRVKTIEAPQLLRKCRRFVPHLYLTTHWNHMRPLYEETQQRQWLISYGKYDRLRNLSNSSVWKKVTVQVEHQELCCFSFCTANTLHF